MKATAEKLEKNTVELKIEIEPQRLLQAIEQAYRKEVKKVNIPGFRKGKAPRFIFEHYMGKEVLYHEAAEILIPEAYYDAVKETGVDPIDKPEIEVVQLEEGKPAIFKAKVEVKPEVTLGEYKNLEVSVPFSEVTEDDVEKELEMLRSRYAKLVPVEEGTVGKGDSVTIDFTGKIDGREFKGGRAIDYQLEVGSGAFVQGFEDQIVGMAVGETKNINVTFPADYIKKELAGKNAEFEVTVKGIKRKELAPLDDELAKDVSEFDTLEELKKDITSKLKEAKENLVQKQVEASLVEEAVSNAEVEVPETMIKNQVERMFSELENNLQYQGLSLGDYMRYTGKDRASLEEQFRSEAQKAIKNELVLEAIARKENIAVTEEEVSGEVQKMAERYKQDTETVKKILEAQGNLEKIKANLLRKKTVKFLKEHARLVEENAAQKEKECAEELPEENQAGEQAEGKT